MSGSDHGIATNQRSAAHAAVLADEHLPRYTVRFGVVARYDTLKILFKFDASSNLFIVRDSLAFDGAICIQLIAAKWFNLWGSACRAITSD